MMTSKIEIKLLEAKENKHLFQLLADLELKIGERIGKLHSTTLNDKKLFLHLFLL